MNKIIIVDYGLGNLLSVKRAVSAAGGDPVISGNPKDILNNDRLILPGVGAFSAGMEGLKKAELIEPFKEAVRKGKKVLGICLGMQLLMETSEEFGLHKGLGLIEGHVKLLAPKNKDLKIPQIGWNSLFKPRLANWENTILEDVKIGEMAYFVHSYGVYPSKEENWLAQTEYGGEIFCSVVSCGNIEATQFHPEKSAEVGQRLLRKFINK